MLRAIFYDWVASGPNELHAADLLLLAALLLLYCCFIADLLPIYCRYCLV